MSVTSKVLLRLACAAAPLGLALTARAVEVGSSFVTTDPGTAGWNYVGSLNGASGVFLGNYGGNGWVLTAAHVGAGSFTLGGATYSATGTTFSNFTYNSQVADLTLFQISGTPSLANLSLAQPPTGSSVELIGFGGGKSWGDNTIYGYTTYTLSGSTSGGPGIVTLASALGGNGAQGVGGDSGGGMFFNFSGSWYLTGVLSGAGDLGGGLGNGTIAVDLAVYVGQIATDLGSSITAIPEPATCAALCGFGTLLGAAIRRRRGSCR